MHNKQNLVGQKFNRLTVVVDSTKRRKGAIIWGCLCECGGYSEIVGYSLKNGSTKSCGCLVSERAKLFVLSNTKHGQRGSVKSSITYNSWAHLIHRCTNPNYKGYKNYGGRGITVCSKWLESFENFYADMGERPKGKSIDRIDVNGNYELLNCRWATPKEQSNNKRNSKSNKNLHTNI